MRSKRQVFLTEKYYKNIIGMLNSSKEFWRDQVLDEDYPGQAAALKALHIKSDLFMALVLSYTAGEHCSGLAPMLARYVDALECYQQMLAACEGEESISPLNLEDSLGEYHEFLQTISLCILLNREDLLRRVVRLTDQAGFIGEDLVCELLLSKVLTGRCRQNGWYHRQYTQLVGCIDSSANGAASSELELYCKNWYPGFSEGQVDWHDSHLRMTDDDGSYSGYWAFEAAAVAYLYDIDDGLISSMVYPRDLVVYARAAKL